MFRPTPLLRLAGALLLAVSPAWSQATAAEPDAGLSLQQAFAAAWARQPEAQSLSLRQQAAEAERSAAERWIAAPAALELSSEGDQLTDQQGSREHALGLALPLWLPGERSRSAAVAAAEADVVASRAAAAQLRTAAQVRQAYWNWRRSQLEQALADERLQTTRQLAADVARRVAAGELARADQHQADAAVALAEGEQAMASADAAGAALRLQGLTGVLPHGQHARDGEPLPADDAGAPALARHPELTALRDQAARARSAADLARVQTRANPELTLSTRRSRELAGDPYDQSIALGLRIPLGSAASNRARQASAQAEALEAEVQLQLQRARLLAARDAAQQRLAATRRLCQVAEQRARLAEESRGFFARAFRLGEADLPTRLRIELDAGQARRQAELAHLEQAAAVSSLRQALGLLPE